jgi:CubicO group peptidase (beta-lactamase class C family)
MFLSFRIRSVVVGLVLPVGAAVCATACGGTSTSTPASVDTRPDLSGPWAPAAPSDVGLQEPGLAAADAHASQIPRFRALLVARHARLAFERYFGGPDASTRFDVRSVTKSVVSALTGTALRDQALPGIDATVAGYLDPPFVLDDEDRRLTVRHLLTMTSGFEWNDDRDYNPWILSADHVRFLLERPHASPPGARFQYNSAAVHLLGVVLQKATRTPLPQYANDQLFPALGVEGVQWEALENGTVNGGSGIALRARDLLKLGQLYLQGGRSGSRSVVPESWVDETTRAQFSWRDDYGAQRRVSYGMLWWVSDADPPCFFAWGYGGQFVYVVPRLDLVVVATTEWRNLTETTPIALAEEVLGVVVNDVLPAAR